MEISYPFESQSQKNLEVIIKAAPEKFSSLKLKVKKNINKRIRQEDLSKLSFISSNLKNIQNLEISIQDCQLSDDTLMDIFSCIFWKNDSLKRIYLEYFTEGEFSKSFFFFAERVLSSAQNLLELHINFPKCKVPSEIWSSLIPSISQLARNLTKLFVLLPSDNVEAEDLIKLFVKMPNLEEFRLHLPIQRFNDEVLNTFVLNTLPSLTKLVSFVLDIQNSSVTDSSVKNFFDSLPQEWLSQVEDFQVDLSRTRVTDDSLKLFENKIPQRMEKLIHFSIHLHHTQVSQQRQKALSTWAQAFSTKNYNN